MHQHEEEFSPRGWRDYVVKQINEELGLNIKRPHLFWMMINDRAFFVSSE